MSVVILIVWYLIGGLVMCWQIKAPAWWAPIAPALAIGGLFYYVPRDIWFRQTGRGEQADQEFAEIISENHDWYER
jgi:CHASE2 domain-containing sensor protein